MAILDKVKAAGERMVNRARRGMDQGRVRVDEAQARREQRKLMGELGEAAYAEHSGQGSREAVAASLAALDAHAQTVQARQARAAQGRHAYGQGGARQARDIMHPGAECVREQDSVSVAAQMMRDLGVGSLPICGRDDRLHGIITDRDVTVKVIAQGRDPRSVLVGELAQGTLFWVDAGANLGEVLHQMEDHQVKRLPVIENHRLIGIISEADLARNLDEHRLAQFVEKVYAKN